MYTIAQYGAMIADARRMAAYEQALSHAVSPGCTVVDIGAGTGIFALLACRLGAAHVYAIEADDVIELGREIAAANGLAERITFIHELSTRVELPDRVDVIVSDLHDALPLFARHIPTIVDARERFLRPGGRLVPSSDVLHVALATNESLYRQYEDPWRSDRHDLDMEAARRMAIGTWQRVHLAPGQLLSSPQPWATLDFETITHARVAATIDLEVARSGTAHGLCVWFDMQLADGVALSNAPGAPPLVYGQGFFPLERPVAVAAGDQARVTIDACLVGDDYVWCWNTRVARPGGDPPLVAELKQSSLAKFPLSPESFRRRAEDFVPGLGEVGEIDRTILERMAAGASLGEIARLLVERHPRTFTDPRDALARVADLSERYAR